MLFIRLCLITLAHATFTTIAVAPSEHAINTHIDMMLFTSF